MHKEPDLPPRSDEPNCAPDSTSTAQGSESAHYADWMKLTSSAKTKEVEQFFKRWEVPAPDLTECPAETELLKAVEDSKSEQWTHIDKCESCQSLVALISQPNRMRIPVNKILAEASRRAWKVEHSEHRRSFTTRHVQSVYNSIPLHQRTLAFRLAGAAVILIVGSFVYQYYRSKPPSPVVAFDNRPTPVQGETYAQATQWFDKPTEILEARNYDVKEKVKQLEPLQSTKPNIETTFTQANLDGSKRAEAGTLVAKYNNQVKVLKDSASAKNIETKDLSVPQTEDSKIVSKVWLAFGSTGTPIAFNTEDLRAARIILEAAEFTKVKSIEPKADQKTIVTITLPKNELDEHAVNERVKSLAEQGLEVKVAYTAARPPKAKM